MIGIRRVTVAIVITAAIVVLLSMNVVSAKTIYVPDSYTTIQSAIEETCPGDVIIVRSGTYYENIVLNKKLSLIGENFPTIDAKRYGGSAITITADGCIVKGFRCNNTFYPKAGLEVVSNSNIIEYNIFENNIIGVLVKNSSENIISNNVFTKSNRFGTFLKSSKNNSILNNHFKKCGIFVGNSYDNEVHGNTVNGKPLVYLENVNDTEITDADVGQMILVKCNRITVKNCSISNTTVGIELWKSSNCTIINNEFRGNYFGISLWHSSGNSITSNSFEDKVGLTIPEFCSNSGISLRYSSKNSILNNSFNDCGLFVWDSYDNEVYGNTVNGKPLVYLENVNGTEVTDAGQVVLVECSRITVKNCSINHTMVGIELWKSCNCTIENNGIFKSSFGVLLWRSPKNKVLNNTCEENYEGILSSKSWRNKIINNTFENCICGIFLSNSPKNRVSNNNFNKCGIFIEFSYHNDMEGNTVNGKPLVYLENVNDTEVTDAGQVILVKCNRITVKNCSINHTTGGIKLWKSHNCTIENNKILNSKWGGIHLCCSSMNRISSNTVDKADEAIHLKFSQNNKILNNTINNTSSWGMFLWKSSENRILKNKVTNGGFIIFIRNASNNRIFLNSFENNTYSIHSYHSDNTWNTTRSVPYIYLGKTYKNYMGNYWSDYAAEDVNGDGIGDMPYKVDDNDYDYDYDYDYHPLIQPIEFYSRWIENTSLEIIRDNRGCMAGDEPEPVFFLWEQKLEVWN